MDERVWEHLLELGLERLTDVYGSTETGALGIRDGIGDPFTAIAIDPSHKVGTDLLDWVDGHRFNVLGRTDGMVQVGGVNVSPAAVESFLRSCPGVRDAAVRLGSGRLDAFIVPKSDMDLAALERLLRTRVKQELRAVECPGTYTFGDAVPVNSMGKACGWTSAA
jgi:4-coumarate--CoA ligase